MPVLPWNRIKELYEAGCSLQECADISGTNFSTIYSHARRNGWDLRPRGPAPGSQRLPNSELDKTRILYEQGYSTIEIGKMLHVSHSTVNYRLRKAGVPIRTNGEGIKAAYDRGRRFGGRTQTKKGGEPPVNGVPVKG